MPSVKKIHVFIVLMTAFCHCYAQTTELSDPTRPIWLQKRLPSNGTNAAAKWLLSSTLIAPQRRLATINGRTVTVGALVNGAKVVAIEPARVRLSKGNKEFHVELLPVGEKRFSKRLH